MCPAGQTFPVTLHAHNIIRFGIIIHIFYETSASAWTERHNSDWKGAAGNEHFRKASLRDQSLQPSSGWSTWITSSKTHLLALCLSLSQTTPLLVPRGAGLRIVKLHCNQLRITYTGAAKRGRSHSVTPNRSCLSSPEIQQKSAAKLFPKFILEQVRFRLNQLRSSWASPSTVS